MNYKNGFSALHVGEQIGNELPSEADLVWFYKDAQKQEDQVAEVDTENLSDDQLVLIKKKKNKKKHKKIIFDMEELSPFTKWLLAQKSISNDRIAVPAKDKSNKIKETAKKSIKASEDIISEPLAIILMKQGHYLESKKMFQKLSSRYPDREEDYLRYISEINDMIERKL